MKKESNEKVIIILTILLFLALLYFFANLFNLIKLKEVQAVSSESFVESTPEILKNENPIDIDNIIEKNRNIDIKEEMKYEEMDLEYTTQYIDNEELPSGTIHVAQLGVNGIQDVITIKRYNLDELLSEQIVASNVKKASINKIVEIGTGRRKK